MAVMQRVTPSGMPITNTVGSQMPAYGQSVPNAAYAAVPLNASNQLTLPGGLSAIYGTSGQNAQMNGTLQRAAYPQMSMFGPVTPTVGSQQPAYGDSTASTVAARPNVGPGLIRRLFPFLFGG